MFIEIERITTTTYIKDINLIDTNMMGPRHYHGNKSIVIINNCDERCKCVGI